MKKILSTCLLAMISLPVFATAPASAAPQQGSSLPSILMLVVFMVVFYFLLIRPQMKRNKEQRQLVSTLQKGDEVLTSSGICGSITKVDNNFVELEIAKDVVVKFQKQAIVSLLPKISGGASETN
jgi:preprotein translocase subunit YajC